MSGSCVLLFARFRIHTHTVMTVHRNAIAARIPRPVINETASRAVLLFVSNAAYRQHRYTWVCWRVVCGVCVLCMLVSVMMLMGGGGDDTGITVASTYDVSACVGGYTRWD